MASPSPCGALWTAQTGQEQRSRSDDRACDASGPPDLREVQKAGISEHSDSLTDEQKSVNPLIIQSISVIG